MNVSQLAAVLAKVAEEHPDASVKYLGADRDGPEWIEVAGVDVQVREEWFLHSTERDAEGRVIRNREWERRKIVEAKLVY